MMLPNPTQTPPLLMIFPELTDLTLRQLVVRDSVSLACYPLLALIGTFHQSELTTNDHGLLYAQFRVRLLV